VSTLCALYSREKLAGLQQTQFSNTVYKVNKFKELDLRPRIWLTISLPLY
jgi:hypothetical protein